MMRLNNRQIVGLDIHDRWIKAIQIRRSSGSWEIGKTLQRNIGMSGDAEDSEFFQEQTAYAIKSLLQEMISYPPKRLVTCIRGRDASIKLLKLPGLAGKGAKDKKSVIRYELMSSLL